VEDSEKTPEAAKVRDEFESILERVANAIRGLRFGSIELVIHDSKVVQIERKEKFRFDKPGGH
jgi:hypothetical protein